MLVEDSETIASAVVDLVAEWLPRMFDVDVVRDIQVLCPMTTSPGHDGQRIPRPVDTQPLHTYARPAANAAPWMIRL
jgi:hypothetical protein